MLSRLSAARNEKGFTLIELLIVIAIIGILAAIAIPQFNAYKQRAYDSDAKANLHNLFLACKAYWADETGAQDCDLTKATEASYGYNQSANVTIVTGTGANAQELAWTANAKHSASPQTWYQTSNGNITDAP